MRKKSLITLAMVLTLGMSSTVLAAESIFYDVPAKHWAYQSVAKLAKAGIVEGTGNSKVEGERILTRYEMAIIVGNAMTKIDKADTAAKAEIAKLQVEFAKELKQMSVNLDSNELKQMNARLDSVEKKGNSFGNTSFSIWGRQQWEGAKDSASVPNNYFLRLRLNMTTQLDDNLKFIARWGSDDNVNVATTSGGSVTTQKAYLNINTGNGWEFNVGRQSDNASTGGYLGLGLLNASTQGWDGLNITKISGKANLGLGWFRKLAGAGPNIAGTSTPSVAAGMRTWKMANLVYDFTPNAKAIITHFEDGGLRRGATAADVTKRYNYTSISEVYRFGKDHMWWFLSEYGQNQKAYVNGSNDNTATGYFMALKYGNTDVKKRGSWDVKLEYRKAQAGFDQLWNGSGSDLGEAVCGSTWGGMGNTLDNAKGFALYYEFVPSKNVWTQLSLYSFKNNDGTGSSRQGFRLMNDFAL